MRIIIYQTQFKRDFNKLLKRKINNSKLEFIITELQQKRLLPPKNKNHKLKGDYSDCWECHIEPDLLLIYKMNDDELILIRTGSHSDLF